MDGTTFHLVGEGENEKWQNKNTQIPATDEETKFLDKALNSTYFTLKERIIKKS